MTRSSDVFPRNRKLKCHTVFMLATLRFPALILLIASAAVADDRVDYARDIKPILKQHCYSCHAALKQESALRVDTGIAIRRGGESGVGLIAGKAAESLIIQRITAIDVDERMPSEGPPLGQPEIELLKRWINQGAVSPKDEKPEIDPRKHWAFLRPMRSTPPRTKLQTAINPIDAFMSTEYHKHKLVPVGPASRSAQLRRVYLDLIGLPPSRRQLKNFLNDTAPNAYERVVDQLLSRPEYGERWGRHWMDIWRYSDWYGRRQVNDVRNSYPHIWRWRDWIIQSLNNDKGYDRMVVEMLAADEVDPENDDSIVALGFIVRNWFSLNYDEWMKDLVEHTGKAFLGIRLNCAHCHDHKYDPISQAEYFKFRAFFEPLELRHDRVPGGPALSKYKRYVPSSGGSLKPITAGLARVFDENLDAKTYMYKLGDARDRFDRPPVEPGAPAILGGDQLTITKFDLPSQAWYPGLKPFVQRAEIKQRSLAVGAAESALTKAVRQLEERDKLEANISVEQKTKLEAAQSTVRVAEAALANARSQLDAINNRIAADNARHNGGTGDPQVLSKKAIRAERQSALNAARASMAVATKRVADAKAAGSDTKAKQALAAAQKQLVSTKKQVAAAEKRMSQPAQSYTLLSPTYPRQSTGRRRALAAWMTSNDNPLTARVAVNHIWMRHFGRPFVESVFDFGRAGKSPTHPNLLDWLAVDFMESGWSMKKLHRLIVTSQTYRLSSKIGNAAQENLAIDTDNRFLWHFDRRRMEGETIRDSVLSASGRLDRQQGGQELDVKKDASSLRRSLYFSVYPEAGGMLKFISIFDAPNPGDCYRRSESVVPQQALAMSNSRLIQNESRILAQELSREIRVEEGPPVEDTLEFIKAAFRHILTRDPNRVEIARCDEFIKRQITLYQKKVRSKSATKGNRTGATTSTTFEIRARESLVRVLFNHNDFVSIP